MGPTNYQTVLLVRDGRDVMVSAYFHFLIPSKNKPKKMVSHWRSLMGNVEFDNVKSLMPRFIEVFSKNYRSGGVRVCWSSHIDSYLKSSQNVLVIKYEHLLQDAKKEITKIVDFYNLSVIKDIDDVIANHTFKRKSGRNRGEEQISSFLRKGIIGDYKNHFNEEASIVFEKLHGKVLKRLGYD